MLKYLQNGMHQVLRAKTRQTSAKIIMKRGGGAQKKRGKTAVCIHYSDNKNRAKP